MLPTPSPGETKSRRVQNHVTSPNSGMQRLKRLPAEGWFLLAASFPLAALVTWNITVPLFAGKFGSNPLEVARNFLTGMHTMNQKLSICPSMLSEDVDNFYNNGTIKAVRKSDWIEILPETKILEPKLIATDKEKLSCDLIQSTLSPEIIHWLNGKTTKWRDILSNTNSIEGACVGGTFMGTSDEAKKLISTRYTHWEAKYEYKNGFIGTKETGKNEFQCRCLPTLIYQVCGESLFKIRTMVQDNLDKSITWSDIFTGTLSTGEMLIIPPLSATFLQVESTTGVWLNFIGTYYEESTSDHASTDIYSNSFDNVSYFIDLLSGVEVTDDHIKSCLHKQKTDTEDK